MNRNKQNSFSCEANSICQSFVYFQTSKSKILLCHPGTWIDQKLFQKIEGLKTKIDSTSVVDHELKENFKALLSDHLRLEYETEFSQSKNKILVHFNQMLNERKSFLNWSVSCFEVFNKAKHEDLNLLHEVDLNLFRKALLSASISVWLSLVNGLYDAKYLEDIYHITFFQDAGLIDSQYSYYITEALDQESLAPGQGMKYLISQNVSEEEVKLFKEHPFASYEFLRSLDLLNNTDLSNTVLFGHELSNGEGFPFGYTEQVLASWEKVIILADHLVKYSSTVDYDLLKELEVIRSSKLTILPVRKIFLKAIATISCLHQEVSA